MEKSGCVQLTQTQLDHINRGEYTDVLSLMARWGIATFDEFKALIDSGQYRVVDEN